MITSAASITIASEIFPPSIGGPARHSELLATNLSRLGKLGGVLSYGERSRTASSYPFSTTLIPNSLPRFLKRGAYTARLLALLRSSRTTMYAQGCVAAGLPVMVATTLAGAEYALRIPGDYAWETANRLGLFPAGPSAFQAVAARGRIGRLARVQRSVATAARLVVVPSGYVRDIVLGWGVRPERVCVIPNACALAAMRGPKPSSRNCKRLLVVGRLVPGKGVEQVIEAMPSILKIDRGFHLLIIGSGPSSRMLRRMVEAKELERNVTFTGDMAWPQLDELLRTSFALVNNSMYEGCPHSILEAMAAGLPVVAAATGGTPELILHERNGLLFDQGSAESMVDAIALLHDKPIVRLSLEANARRTAETHSTERMTEALLKAFERSGLSCA